jgi:type II secretory pathway pseudopilin PulG
MRLNCKKMQDWRSIKNRGFTLVEIVMSSVVLLLAIMGSIVALQVAYRELELARATGVVTQVMQSEAERLRLLNWAAISALPAEETINLSTAITSGTLLFGRLNVVRRVEDVADYANMKQIHLVAEWTSVDGRSHVRSLILRYSKGGLHDYYYGS